MNEGLNHTKEMKKEELVKVQFFKTVLDVKIGKYYNLLIN